VRYESICCREQSPSRKSVRARSEGRSERRRERASCYSVKMTDVYFITKETSGATRALRVTYTLARVTLSRIHSENISKVFRRGAISAGSQTRGTRMLLRKYRSVKRHLLMWGSTIRVVEFELYRLRALFAIRSIFSLPISLSLCFLLFSLGK